MNLLKNFKYIYYYSLYNYKKPIFYQITKIVELSVHSNLRFNRELSKP